METRLKGNLKVYGHAGSGLKPEQYNYPPNSLESIRKAIMADGADGVEIDVQMSKDSVLYLFHDDRMEGNTNFEGALVEHISANLDFAFYRKGYLPKDKFPVLRLDDLISWMNEKAINAGLSINIQAQKSAGDQTRFEEKVAELILQASANLTTGSEVYIESTVPEQLDRLVQMKADEKIMWDADINPRTVELAIYRKYDGLVSEFNKTSAAHVTHAKEQGVITVLFGLRIYPNITDALEMEPDIVQTDNVSLTISLRGS